MAFGLRAAMVAQQPAPRPQTPSLAKLPPLFFTEAWKQTGLERNVDNDVLTNPNLELHLYGPTSKQIQIAPTTPNNRQDPPNLWTGDLRRAGGGHASRQEQLCRPYRTREDPLADTRGGISRRASSPEARRRHLARWRSRRRRRHDRNFIETEFSVSRSAGCRSTSARSRRCTPIGDRPKSALGREAGSEQSRRDRIRGSHARQRAWLGRLRERRPDRRLWRAR